ncbi:hypothetical protein DM860_012129 [Cuscuta australis]|uniref:DUF3615 domain-containing protein n=1 Tax=Cuscuta australis TaxID=267555 RepID=A0A328DA40_9ASTE|nr:hypothetical protein DM860_012129 [Cuscuta australis]
MESETTIGKTKEVYNLRSRRVYMASRTRCSPVSKAQKEGTATGRKLEDEEVSKAQKVETAIGKKPEDAPTVLPAGGLFRGPPPLTGQRLKDHQKEKQRELREQATKSLNWYNKGRQQRGLPRYVLVKTMKMQAFALKCGFVHHLNFKARPKDEPAAPPELFFAERVVSWHGVIDTRCYSLGTNSPETGGGEECNLCYKIYHPRDVEFVGRADHLQ